MLPHYKSRPRVERLESRDVPSLVPVGPEFRVNSYTIGPQRWPSLGMDALGDFVVAWASGEFPATAVNAQRYDRTGVALGTEIQVNTIALDPETLTGTAVAMGPGGDFVVAWSDRIRGIRAQKFDRLGLMVGSEMSVYYPPPYGIPADIVVAMDDDGNFVLVWNSILSWPYIDVYARRFDTVGPAGPAFCVNTYTTGDQRNPKIAMDGAGNFVVAWDSYLQDGSLTGVYAQRFNSAGTPQGGEFRVNSYTTGHQSSPAIAMNSAGEFVIAWDGSGAGDSTLSIHGQRYDFAGIPQGPEFLVNTYTTTHQIRPTIAIDTDGDFVVAWSSRDQDGSEYGVFAQAYERQGTPVGGEFQVNTNTTGRQGFYTAAAMDADGDAVIVWHDIGHDGDSYGVYAQRYTNVSPPGIHDAQVNNGAAQRSRVSDLTITFSAQVSFAGPIANAFTLTRTGGGPVAFAATVNVVNGVTVVTLNNFTGPETEFGSLRDGNYTLTALASQISANGQPMAADYTFSFFRFYGDMNGDRRVDISDFGFFSLAFLQPLNYNAALDFNSDGRIDIADFGQFSVRFFTTLP